MAEKISPQLLRHPLDFLALGFGSGLLPRAPGTAGTIAAIPLYLVMQSLALPVYVSLVAVLFLLGIPICAHTAKRLGVHDHPGIVWDEIVGYLVTMIFAPTGWLWVLAGFVLFRFFDVLKPWPIRWLDRRVGGGFGIMVDDLLAGIAAAGVLQLLVIYL
ncbi:MAG: phosphatidylglycerophosphatase A [Gammaproteobacteria bacterium]|jgi:phosphatidylglycerophosphatase A|nr:phosphatidylglycerophosphatase A [Gammaproteobacteria bacterium]MDH3934977.1 phosphatidylglycerophosphatase A [Gammaproteobacteria bacterium]